MTVNLEMFIAQNLLSNLPIIWAAARVAGRTPKKVRLIIASVAGAVYAVVGYLPGMAFASSFPGRVVFAVMMSALAIGRCKVTTLAKASLFTWLATFLFGGAGFSLISLLASKGFMANPWVITVCSLVMGVIFSVALRVYDYRLGSASVDVLIKMNGVVFAGKGFVDSGNHLTEPISGLPVAILSKRVTEKLFPNGLAGDDASLFLKIRHVPYSSIGNPGGVLLAVKCSEITVNGFLTSPIMIALNGDSLSEWDVILPSSFITKTHRNKEEAKNGAVV